MTARPISLEDVQNAKASYELTLSSFLEQRGWHAITRESWHSCQYWDHPTKAHGMPVNADVALDREMHNYNHAEPMR